MSKQKVEPVKPEKLISTANLARILGWHSDRVRKTVHRLNMYVEHVGRDAFIDGEAFITAIFFKAPLLRDQALARLRSGGAPGAPG